MLFKNKNEERSLEKSVLPYTPRRGSTDWSPVASSEMVIPLHADGKPVAVLDLDSPLLNRFTKEDAEGLLQAAGAIEQQISWEWCSTGIEKIGKIV